MKTSNIVIFNDHSYIAGGAANVAIRSAILLSKYHNVIFVYGLGNPMKELVDSNVKLIKISCPFNRIWNFKLISELNKFFNNYSKHNTYFHIHSFLNFFSVSLIQWIKSKNFKTYVTLHDLFLFCPNGGYFNFKKNKLCSYKPLSLNCILSNCDKYPFLIKQFKLLRFLILKYILKTSDNIKYISISNYSKNIISKLFGFEDSTVVKNVFFPIKFHKSFKMGTGINFSFIGRIDGAKGAQFLAEAARKANIKVNFFGDGPMLKSLKHHYPEHIFHGFIDKNYLHSIYSQSQCVILASRYYELDGLVIREALSLGVPVIVSSTCSSKMYVKSMKNGLIFKSSSETSLLNAIVKMKKLLDSDYKFTFDREIINDDESITKLKRLYGKI